MSKKGSSRWYGVVAFRSIFGVLLGTVMLPTFALTSVGILTLILWRESFDLVFGVIILSISAASVVGGILATALVRRSARRAGEQSDFVSSVSHELKTPLTSIRMYAETLQEGRLTDEAERQECLQHIIHESERLTALIERLLDVRRMAESADVFVREPVHVPELVDAAVRSQVPQLKERGVALRVELEDDLPPLDGDREALVTALANLVQNAVRYGGEKGIVRVRARRDGRTLLIAVEDEGPGIPRRAMRRIFERFYRVDRDKGRTPAPGGVGLGLAIVKQIAEGHGGEVDVKSEEGKGSVFTMRLPLSRGKEPGPSPSKDRQTATKEGDDG